ncbi:MAG: hypothetical protein PWP24_869, partial [Clostridiales bacterium]|nr:hypothetical protein [Clostridiales bacterium]
MTQNNPFDYKTLALAGYKVPTYDRTAVEKETKDHPCWI